MKKEEDYLIEKVVAELPAIESIEEEIIIEIPTFLSSYCFEFKKDHQHRIPKWKLVESWQKGPRGLRRANAPIQRVL